MAMLRTLHRLPARAPGETDQVTYNGGCKMQFVRTGAMVHVVMLDNGGNMVCKLRLTEAEAKDMAAKLLLAADADLFVDTGDQPVEVH